MRGSQQPTQVRSQDPTPVRGQNPTPVLSQEPTPVLSPGPAPVRKRNPIPQRTPTLGVLEPPGTPNSRQPQRRPPDEDILVDEIITPGSQRLSSQWSERTSQQPTCRKSHRMNPCKKCEGCLRPNCGNCSACWDMPKYGGPGKRKKKCEEKVCAKPIQRIIGHSVPKTQPLINAFYKPSPKPGSPMAKSSPAVMAKSKPEVGRPEASTPNFSRR